ncbi:MAG: hypothetical protein Kow0059_16820 [Candidatus Sumerlaeia bacterium]
MPFLRAMILGVTGRVGSALAAHLLAADSHGDDETGEGFVQWGVTGAARCSDTARAMAVMRLGVDVLTFDALRDDPALLPDADVLFLEIWEPRRPELTWPLNVWGVGRVVEDYARRMGERLIIVNGGTINVYGDRPDAPTEQTPCRPTSEYGRSRWAQELLIDGVCARYGARGIHVRYAHANTATTGVVRRMAEKILAGESLGGDPDARLQIIAMEDFVRVTAAATARAATPPAAVNCCHPRVWTKRELAEEIQRRLGRGRVCFDVATGGRERTAIADPSLMISWFGPPQVSLDTVIQRVIDDLAGH